MSSIAVYAGSFDPITNGHMSVIKQALALFSHVRVLVATNPDKRYLYNTSTRKKLIERSVCHLPNVTVAELHNGDFTYEYARQIGATHLVRGVRNETDAGYEMKLAAENHRLAPELQTVLLPCDPKVAMISSSGVKRAVLEWARVRSYEDPRDSMVTEKIKPYVPWPVLESMTLQAISGAAAFAESLGEEL